MPRSIRSRASPLNLISLAAMWRAPWLGGFLTGNCSIDHCEDVGLFHDHKVLAILLHFGARPLPEQDAVADLDIGWVQFSGFIAQARSHSDDFALRRLLLRGVGDEYAARGHRLRFDTTDQDAVLQRTQPYCWPPWNRKIWGSGTVGWRVPIYILYMDSDPLNTRTST